MSSVKTQYTLCSIKDPRPEGLATLVFDEISNTQVLGGVKLANRAGKQLITKI